MVIETGVIKCFFSNKGFGFIYVSGSSEQIYFSSEAFRGDIRKGNKNNIAGKKIEFIRGINRKGVAALEVYAIEKKATPATDVISKATPATDVISKAAPATDVISKAAPATDPISKAARVISKAAQVKINLPAINKNLKSTIKDQVNTVSLIAAYKFKIGLSKALIRIIDFSDKAGDYLQDKSNKLSKTENPKAKRVNVHG